MSNQSRSVNSLGSIVIALLITFGAVMIGFYVADVVTSDNTTGNIIAIVVAVLVYLFAVPIYYVLFVRPSS